MQASSQLRRWRGVLAAAPLLAVLSGICGTAQAHGLIQDPPSRNWFCGALTKPDQIGQGTAKYPECQGAFATDFSGSYNFMSVLTHDKGRASVTPLPANVCGFNSENWGGKATPWDTPINWPTNAMTSGRQKFTWNISWGPHFSDTEEFRYWITKPNFVFQVGKPLAWTDFEEAPFCTLKYDDTQPTANADVVPDKTGALFHTYCTVPQRSGRQVIYAEWGRNYFTYERFHGCVDAVFAGDGQTPAVKSVIALSPNVTTFTGAGTLTLDGSGSTGSNLSYQWSLNTANPANYTLQDATKASARLVLNNPSANETLLISLLVKNGSDSSNASVSITHKPASTGPAWTDLGAVSASSRTLQAGDQVNVRVVSKTGVDQYVPATPLTLTTSNASATAWPLALAQAVNAANGGLRIGALDAQGQVVPAANATENRFYAAANADIASAFLQVKPAATGALTATSAINSDWGTGYCANVTVANGTASTVSNWSANLKVVGKVTQMWNATWSQTGDTLAFSGPSWAASLAPGASFTQAGFCASR
ncbi:lytic polysaccharide monooxygenase [Niveibacterium sp. SC-1]|uniref:lytic polysaccharide monooxygenase n=1 Tax=Niveibacterium sp. SC-1 TaxID=3135646 RepID=UPI00311F3A31